MFLVGGIGWDGPSFGSVWLRAKWDKDIPLGNIHSIFLKKGTTQFHQNEGTMGTKRDEWASLGDEENDEWTQLGGHPMINIMGPNTKRG